ncbi:hypothetical protein JCM11251_001136 [Rhodosporidiobolus azoricus]
MQSTRTAVRKPLAALPLEPFLTPASTSTSSSSSPSPKKRSRLTGDMSLLPSPFLSTTSTTPRHASGPLTTLYEAPRGVFSGSPGRRVQQIDASSPQRRMLVRDEEERLGDDEMPPSSPRRLLDLFQESEKRGSGSGLGGSGSSSVRGMRGSMPPPSPRRTLLPFVGRKAEKDQEETPTAPTWSFYQDDESAVPDGDPDAVAQDATMSSPAASEEGADLTPVDKENARPSPRRRRSASLLSPSSTPILTTATTPFPPPAMPASTHPSPARPPPLALPLPSASAPPVLDHAPLPRTPPAVDTSSPGFPSYPDLSATMTNPLAAFSEGAATSFSPTSRDEEAGVGYLLGGGSKKRQSLEQAGGAEKRLKEE